MSIISLAVVIVFKYYLYLYRLITPWSYLFPFLSSILSQLGLRWHRNRMLVRNPLFPEEVSLFKALVNLIQYSIQFNSIQFLDPLILLFVNENWKLAHTWCVRCYLSSIYLELCSDVSTNTRRDVITKALVAGSAALVAPTLANAYDLPDLPYPFEALEPYIDAPTMKIHHDKHHATYVANINKVCLNK